VEAITVYGRWEATAAANMRHSRMRPQKRQVAVLGRAHTKSSAEHIGVCAIARGIHRSFERDSVED
jgi:hypothetical protein